ncbi:universal stress protein [Jiangella anatolica]|uniref:Universal stress protein n=1 Tax=Jiangella anatolica TaxID=2670374 RepID=A0A2W2D0S9_9ACTN|nr:universal stress protein [Jiangella anatolica]PZF86123.1 universal stress protein [Jiangella anatolica]
MWNTLTATARPIVVGIDGRPDSEAALHWAVATARLHRAPLRVVLVADAPELQRYVPYRPDVAGETFMVPAHPSRHPSDDDLDRALAFARLRLRPGTVTGRRAPGAAAPALIEDSVDAAMLVVGTRRRGPVATATLGSVSATVAAHARCPVVVVGTEPQAAAGRPIVAGVADDRAADGVLGFAFREALARQAPLSVVHIGRPDLGEPRHPERYFGGMVPTLAARLANYASRYRAVAVSTRLSAADPGDELAGASAGAQLVVVVGSRGRGRISGLILGSVGQRLLHDARCPVAVVHPARARTPSRTTTAASRSA